MEIAITSCSRTTDILRLFKTPVIIKNIKTPGIVLCVNFDFVESFEDLGFNEVNRLSYNCSDISAVISFWSANMEKFAIFWKSKDLRRFLVVTSRSNVPLDENDIHLFKFVNNFLAKSLRSGQLGMP